MDHNPFDSDLMHSGDELDGAEDSAAMGEGFDEAAGSDGMDLMEDASDFNAFSDEGDAMDAFAGDESTEAAFSADAADLANGSDGFDYGDSADGASETGDAMALWDAFEDEVADGLDAADEDEFLGRILGGLGRAGGLLRRGLGGAAHLAGRVQGVARQAQRVAGGLGRVAGQVSPAAQAAARLAQMLGAQGVAGGLGSLAVGAQRAQGWAQTAGQLAGRVSQTAGGAQGVLSQLSQLIGQGGNEMDDFDALADAFEDGVDEALPAVVALAARAAARGLGFANVAHLAQAGRRALVRGTASAARELVRRQGRGAVRALPRLAASAARVATRTAATPQRAALAVRRGLPATARRVAQQPHTLQTLARTTSPVTPQARARQAQAAHPQPLTRDAQLGRGQPTRRIRGARTFYIDGPVALTVTPR